METGRFPGIPAKKLLHSLPFCVNIIPRNTPILSLLPALKQGARDQKEVRESMNKYELAVVLSAKLEEDERAAAIEKIKGYITRFGGTVTNIDEWGKKKLAYEIQKMKEAFYYFIQFDGNSDTPNELESHVRIMEPVIRYLCVKQEV